MNTKCLSEHGKHLKKKKKKMFLHNITGNLSKASDYPLARITPNKTEPGNEKQAGHL